MLMGFPADMAVVLVEKARDDDAKVAEAAERGKKALAEREAAARTVGTRRERASISLDELRSTVGGGALEDLCDFSATEDLQEHFQVWVPLVVGVWRNPRHQAKPGSRRRIESKSHLLDEGRELEVLNNL